MSTMQRLFQKHRIYVKDSYNAITFIGCPTNKYIITTYVKIYDIGKKYGKKKLHWNFENLHLAISVNCITSYKMNSYKIVYKM